MTFGAHRDAAPAPSIAHHGEGFTGQQDANQRPPDGEVHIKKDKSGKPREDDGFGEYVDFEDVNE